MRKILILILTLLCINMAQSTVAQALDKKVSVQYANVTIEEALKDITKKYGVKFSYSSNIIPTKKKINVSASDKPLRLVLEKIFADAGISFQEVGSQVVLKKVSSAKSEKAPEKKTSAYVQNGNVAEDTVSVISPDAMVSTEPAAPVVKEDSAVFFKVPDYSKIVEEDTLDKESLRRKYQSDKRKLRDQYYRKLDSLEGRGEIRKEDKLKGEFKEVLRKLRDEVQVIGDSLENINWRSPDSSNLFRKKKQDDSVMHKHRPGQVSFVYPIGTNGVESPEIVNNVSLNMLAGVNGGTQGVELGGLVNVDKYEVRGTQIAGLGNVAGKEVSGGQFSGLFNINNAYTNGVQASGFMNIVADSVLAVQGAGFMNVVSGSAQGGQFAGFSNFTQGNVYGMQGAGFMNTAGNDVYGGQVAGFLNVAGDDVRGAQIAGFMNVAPDTVRGVQVAGFMNIGGTVKGSQIGVINFADTVTGAQIGFISFAKKGYRRLELWGSESLYGNLAFKTGTSHFYNIFAGGIRPDNNVLTWGFGYGIGSEMKLSRRMIMNFDLLAYNIHKDGFQWDELNLLNQARMNVGFLVTPKISFFAGPVFNVMVSNHYNADNGTYGSDITPSYAFFDRTYTKTNVAMWVGGNVGLRF